MTNPMITAIDQVAVVVEDAGKTAKWMEQKLGLGPWVCLQFGDDGSPVRYGTIEDCVCEGDPIGTYSIDCCCCDMPNGVQLEVISPKTGSSIFARWLQRYGPGVQHISVVLSDSYEASIARMAAAGHTQGQFTTVMTTERCAFVEHLQDLGTYLELHKRPESAGGPPDDSVDVTFLPGPTHEDLPQQPALFTQLEQINIETTDLQRSLTLLQDSYGIGPWQRGDHSAVCDTLNIRLKLIETQETLPCGAVIRTLTAVKAAPAAEEVPAEACAEGLRLPLRSTFGADLILRAE